ncbi:MAG: MBL fold metallo-hydrolase [Hyphomicrobium sp.]|jgi:glyoxylase-like metal-dependent hydrolase (beta-lactamase superfamily II)
MLNVSRRTLLLSAAVAGAALGLDKRLALITSAEAQTTPDPAVGFAKYKVGDVEITALYDGIFEKPHDPAFIKNASVDEVKAAMTAAGNPADFVSIPLTVVVLEIGGKYILCDSGSGGQWQPTAGKLAANMAAAGIDPAKISTILVSHFHPDHIFGLMQKDTNAAVYPNAEIIVHSNEYKWWMEPGRVEKLPEARKKLGARIQSVFSGWKNIRQVEAETEVVPGVRFVSMPGHTAGHVAFHLSSGNDQLIISNDTCYVPALNVAHPGWHGAYDQDGPLAEASRRSLMDRVVADKVKICGSHFPFPGLATIAKDGANYALTTTKI